MLPALIAFQLLRIIQEALANVRKHAGARNTWISFERLPGDRLEMIVRDDGQGFDLAVMQQELTRKTFGFASMRERVESLGGQLKIESQPGLGTTVTARTPLKHAPGY
jgi:signal transduction histidine kinase